MLLEAPLVVLAHEPSLSGVFGSEFHQKWYKWRVSSQKSEENNLWWLDGPLAGEQGLGVCLRFKNP